MEKLVIGLIGSSLIYIAFMFLLNKIFLPKSNQEEKPPAKIELPKEGKQ